MKTITVKSSVPFAGLGFFKFIKGEAKLGGKWLTPFNIISIPVILVGLVLIVIRFVYGLGSVTNLSNEFPWGIWIGFDVMAGVAFAGGAYVLTFMVYILNMKKYKPIIQATVLNGLLAYMFYAACLVIDCGRPWNALNPFIGNSFGMSSIMFLVAWHFMLYMVACLVEFSPAIAKWIGMPRLRKVLSSLTVGAVIIGITLSTLHQAGLGALFLLAKGKLHPLWYNEYLPILFFVSSIFAGLSMVIIESTISHRVFKDQINDPGGKKINDISFGLSKICATTMFVYIFLVTVVFIHGQHWKYLNSSMGQWFLVEYLGFLVLPMVAFIIGFRYRKTSIIKFASILALLGIVVNRLNVSVIAFKWNAFDHYFPSWQEIWITAAIIFLEVWIFRWVIRRLPVLSSSPAWACERKNLKAA